MVKQFPSPKGRMAGRFHAHNDWCLFAWPTSKRGKVAPPRGFQLTAGPGGVGESLSQSPVAFAQKSFGHGSSK
jgi:hypothetical protein